MLKDIFLNTVILNNPKYKKLVMLNLETLGTRFFIETRKSKKIITKPIMKQIKMFQLRKGIK